MPTHSSKASKLSTWLLHRSLGPVLPRRRVARLLHKTVLRFWRRPFVADYAGQTLLFPGQHDLPVLANDLPLFNGPLGRLASEIRNHEGRLRFLDIGANVGEGVPLVGLQPADLCWLVEGSEEFLPYLRFNTAGKANITIFPVYVAEKATVSHGREVVRAGNAQVVEDSRSRIRFETVDGLFASRDATLPNLLKLDVEGHEARVLAGSQRLLREAQPAVLTEWHPHLLAEEGLDALAPLDLLEASGYDDVVVYDNHGRLLCSCRLEDRALLAQLSGYARLRELFYYDLAVFAPRHASLLAGFTKRESEFYDRLPPRAAQKP